MIIPEMKIQVFISSACGDEPEKQKYNFVREALKTLIESTGFAKTYVFESEGGSITPAGHHYISALEDCDVCIFLIDNRDGISPGTQKEIDVATKHGIKSMFYFCDQFSKDETPLQKSLKGVTYAKSVTVHDFKDLIKSCAIDLMNDLVLIYKHYCKGRLGWRDDGTDEQSGDIENMKLSIHTNNVVQKDLLANIDNCIQYFTKLILGHSFDEVEKTGRIDKLCVAFLPVLLEGASYSEENFNALLSEIEKQQSSQFYSVVKKRHEAIRAYYVGDQKGCIEKLKGALQLAKQNGLDEWFIKDILIDLRNQNAFYKESQNTYSLDEMYQQELNNSSTLLYYPLLDRFDRDYYEGIIEEVVKYKMQAPGTVSLGHGLGKHIRSLAGTYVLAMYNGSLTHIHLLYERIKYMAFYCATRYSNWSIKKLLLKATIIDGKEKEIDGVIRCFDDLRSKMDAKDAEDIYSFADNHPIAYRQFIAKLQAFRVTAYYMDNTVFERTWAELNRMILQWVEDEKSIFVTGSHIFSALDDTHLRIPQDQLIEIVCSCITQNKRRFYDDIFKLIYRGIDLDHASIESASNLLEVIIGVVKNPDERVHIHTIEPTLYTLRKKFRYLTEELDQAIAVEMPDFYNGTYCLETTDNEDADMPSFLSKYITEIQKDNETQGQNGRFFGRANQSHITIKNILKQSSVVFSNNLIDSAFESTCETLLRENQTIEAKMDAIELLVYLIKSRPRMLSVHRQKTAQLLASKPQIEAAKAMMTNLGETNLRLSALLLYHCLGENITIGILNALVDIGDDDLSNRKASKAFLNYLEASAAPVSDTLLENIILQKTIVWCANSDLDIRWNAVQILFLLLRNADNKNIICNQLVRRMDADNVYIKNKILRNACQLKKIDPETLNYIIEKAAVDANYLVCKVAEEVRTELE